MQRFIEVYRDPLFGIIVLLAIIAIVAIADYSNAKHRRRKRKESISNIGKNFDSHGHVEGLSQLLAYGNRPADTLLPLAGVYSKSGDHERAISIYISLLDVETENKLEILELLGVSYYNAGFLHRAKNILTEVLKNNPNNPKALKYFIVVCEDMGMYKDALDALNCMEEIKSLDPSLEIDTESNKNYLEVLDIISNYQFSNQKSRNKLKALYYSKPELSGLILRHFKIYDHTTFWELISERTDISNYIDLLWYFEYHQIPFEHIQNNTGIKQVYCSKGYISEEVPFDNFYLETIYLFNRYSKTKCMLDFGFRCISCNSSLPFYSHRCPICFYIGENETVLKVKKKH